MILHLCLLSALSSVCLKAKNNVYLRVNLLYVCLISRFIVLVSVHIYSILCY